MAFENSFTGSLVLSTLPAKLHWKIFDLGLYFKIKNLGFPGSEPWVDGAIYTVVLSAFCFRYTIRPHLCHCPNVSTNSLRLYLR